MDFGYENVDRDIDVDVRSQHFLFCAYIPGMGALTRAPAGMQYLFGRANKLPTSILYHFFIDVDFRLWYREQIMFLGEHTVFKDGSFIEGSTICIDV
ncbi:hypothetical protein LX64_00295 [Chitinophaga skermanii]|uniref:Uncharacterized protein n=1 Tax=Chitinophaga skermanii TaxID=331697 RepID=A0A327R1G0_9BACT|nr:hypothetical protein LX64_00295 [Chitinophaga skermanii]